MCAVVALSNNDLVLLGCGGNVTMLDKRRGAEILAGRSNESRDRCETRLVAAGNVEGGARALAGHASELGYDDGRVAAGQYQSGPSSSRASQARRPFSCSGIQSD